MTLQWVQYSTRAAEDQLECTSPAIHLWNCLGKCHWRGVHAAIYLLQRATTADWDFTENCLGRKSCRQANPACIHWNDPASRPGVAACCQIHPCHTKIAFRTCCKMLSAPFLRKMPRSWQVRSIVPYITKAEHMSWVTLTQSCYNLL